MSGVCPHSCSSALTSALSSSRTRIALDAAGRRGEVQRRHAARRCSRASTLDRASTRALTTPALPLRAAMCSGVYWPMRVTAHDVGAAVDEQVRSARASPRSAAQCSAVMPSPCGALTSAPSLNSALDGVLVASAWRIGDRRVDRGPNRARASHHTRQQITQRLIAILRLGTAGHAALAQRPSSENSPVLSPNDWHVLEPDVVHQGQHRRWPSAWRRRP